VAEPARSRGGARRLYDNLFAAARDAGHDRIVCEVNVDPPNPASDAFHARFGFSETGRAKLADGKVVRHLNKSLLRPLPTGPHSTSKISIIPRFSWPRMW
jgi:hypothetical protein